MTDARRAGNRLRPVVLCPNCRLHVWLRLDGRIPAHRVKRTLDNIGTPLPYCGASEREVKLCPVCGDVLSYIYGGWHCDNAFNHPRRLGGILCRVCHGAGVTEEGDPERGSAPFDCEACGGTGEERNVTFPKGTPSNTGVEMSKAQQGGKVGE